jgi:FolB domain-containing protein
MQPVYAAGCFGCREAASPDEIVTWYDSLLPASRIRSPTCLGDPHWGRAVTRMLASVDGPAEAEIALAGGADIIDLKDPSRGALGAVATDVIQATVKTVGKRRLVSAVAGDLPMQPGLVAAAARDIAATGVDYVKLGIFPGGDAAACIDAVAGIAACTKLIAVLFADASPDLSLLPLLKRGGFAGAMLDTQGKAAGRLLDHFDLPRLGAFVADCHALGMIAGLAGSLETPDIPRLLVLAPDLLGFRGALCGPGGRTAALDPGRVQAVRGLIPPQRHEAGTQDVDYRLLAARGYAPGSGGDDVPVDLVFVDDLVLPVFIGAYTRERAAPQNVRFGVTASVMRTGRAAEDMRDVFSYDLITDGIRLLIGAGHIPLVETLAERIAAMVLGHPRVTKVVVRVEKLETGSGRVGVEIERVRTAARTGERPMGERPMGERAMMPSLAAASGKSWPAT